MLPSVLPRLSTDSVVRVFSVVWKLLFLRLPSRDGAPSLPLLSMYYFLTSIYLFFIPVILPSVLPRLTTDSAVRVFPGVWKPLF